ncbi:MAG TPA: DUF6438 domain-containing protein [Bacteroidia bacterium]|nr:DUF6438 domain-containing protein [Bacteroidia bacterium]
MYSIKKTVFAVAIIIAVTSCSRKKAVEESTAATTADSLVAYIERTPCFGRCPNYSIRLYQSGYAVYEGYNNVPNIGRYFTRISGQEVKSIGEKAKALHFFELNDSYRNPHLTDFPTVFIEVNYDHLHKKIVHYDADPPKALLEMEDFIDAVFKDRKWQLHPVQTIKE